MEKRLSVILACLFLCVGMVLAQNKISGTVVSAEDGEPVIGASVMIQADDNASESMSVTSSMITPSTER